MSQAAATCCRIGLTGGMGSGKSTVARMLADAGAALIDADHISRTLTAAGGAAMPAIAQTFGAALLAPDGALDRAGMRQLVFSQPQARQQLEAIIHPLVGQEILRQAQIAQAQGARLLVHDIPLLVESGHWRSTLDAVVVVDCRESTQIERVVARNQLPPTAVQAMLAAQASRSQRRACADAVLYNDGLSLDALRLQVVWLAHQFGL